MSNVGKKNKGVHSLRITRYGLPRRHGFIPHHFSNKGKSGAGLTLIEVLIATFIIGTVVTGIFGLFVLALRTSGEAEHRVGAIALANERAEMIRNLPYKNVGTSGGIPSGSILQQENITRNGIRYVVKTDIRYIDDPFDGTAGGNPNDTLNTDYKQARIEVSWSSPNQPKPILLILDISPPGVEGGEVAGTLIFQALNSAGQGIDAATVQLVNSTVNPPINITTQTQSNGQVVLPGLPESSGTYQLAVSKNGFTQEQTYPSSSSFLPDINHSNLSALKGQLTPKTFIIDQVASLAITTQDTNQAVIGNVAYSLKGTKTIGTDGQGMPVYVLNTTGSTSVTGQATHSNLIWDTYDFAINGVATGYDIKETNLLLPLTINPADNAVLTVTLVPHTPISLHVTVTSASGTPIDNATVHVTGNSVDVTQGTGAVGQVLFTDLPTNGDYNLTIDAPGYTSLTQPVTVGDTTRIRLQLSPTG